MDLLEPRLSQMVDELIPQRNQDQHRFERIAERVLVIRRLPAAATFTAVDVDVDVA